MTLPTDRSPGDGSGGSGACPDSPPRRPATSYQPRTATDYSETTFVIHRHRTQDGPGVGSDWEVETPEMLNPRYLPPNPECFTPAYLEAYTINARNREFHMGRAIGDHGLVDPRPATAGTQPKSHEDGKGHAEAQTYPGYIPLRPTPLGASLSRDPGNNRRAPSESGPRTNLPFSRVPASSIYSPMRDELLAQSFRSQQIFAAEGSLGFSDPIRFSYPFPLESIPQSPLDSSFPPVAPYLTGRLVSALQMEGDVHPRISLLQTCQQCTGIPIGLVFSNLGKITKVNEGVYGEVYSGHFQTAPNPSVYKIVAVEGVRLVNGEKQKRYAEIEPEIKVSQLLNTLRDPTGQNFTRGFCHLYRARLLEGRYPKVLVDAWQSWHEVNQSENECPNFDEGQRYIVFEYEYGGKDVECYRFRNAEQAYALLIQVAFTLGTAEAGIHFEHRDLHWGNILVLPTTEKSVRYTIDGVSCEVPTCGVKSTVIDFTISRCRDKNGNTAFTDLSNDEEQFEGSDDYQFDIYRMMRDENGNDWSLFKPKSNVYWLHYLVGKLRNNAHYEDKTSSTHQSNLKKLKDFEDEIMDHESCAAFAMSQSKYIRREG